ncbi:O-antigen ligase family protein [Algoriphagus boritolerans]|uniref:O-antigen ligase family protein n=1 Tax=Algoriphagus boritolerans TaxID=308111 RepID=UPI0011B091B1|nr:O-antigen ligase family protein [Algoriphagus boritolerans]
MNKTSINIILKTLSYFLALIVILGSSSFGISFGSFFYISILFIFSFLILIIQKEIFIYNLNIFFLVIASVLSLLLNDVPSYFSSYQRLLFFVIILFIIGPLCISQTLQNFRQRLFVILNNFNILFCSFSFLGLISGLYVGLTTRNGLDRPDFTGFYNHSMILGPASSIALLTCLYYFYESGNKIKKIFLIILICLCAMSAITAGSRAALVGLLIGLLFFYYKKYKGRMTRFIKTLSFVVFLLIISFPIWEDNTKFLMNKFNRAEDSNDPFDSRSDKWNLRLTEFQTSPIFGIGFASVSVIDQTSLEKLKGIIEPGSSWLSVLSMTGILGFVPIFIFFTSHFTFLFRLKTSGENIASYLGSLFLLFTLHMLFEGYIFASGAFLFFYLWLFLGILEGYRRQKNLS